MILLYLFAIVSYFQYSYQVNINIIVSYINFLICTFAFRLWVSAFQVFFYFKKKIHMVF